MKNILKILLGIISLISVVCTISYIFNKPIYLSNESEEDYIIRN